MEKEERKLLPNGNVEQRILDSFAYEEGRIPTDTDINDLVWFECDDIFFPEENEDEDEEEENEDDE